MIDENVNEQISSPLEQGIGKSDGGEPKPKSGEEQRHLKRLELGAYRQLLQQTDNLPVKDEVEEILKAREEKLNRLAVNNGDLFKNSSQLTTPKNEGVSSSTLKKAIKARVIKEETRALLEGDWRDFAQYDTIILNVTNRVQERFTKDGHSKKLVKNLNTTKIPEDLRKIINHYALEEVYNETGVPSAEIRSYIVKSVENEILGLGPLEPLWEDESVTEVMCNGPEDIWIEQYGKLKKVNGVRFRDKNQLLHLCQRILTPINRKLDHLTPDADGRLPDGSRVHAVHPRISPTGPHLAIRKFPELTFTMKDLVDFGTLTEEMACTLSWLIRNRATILVSGGTGSGKLLPLNAELPTPTGWTTMGEVKMGDTIVSGGGKPCKVVAVSDVNPAPSMMKLLFSDGQTVVADENHQWKVNVTTNVTCGEGNRLISPEGVSKYECVGVCGGHFETETKVVTTLQIMNLLNDDNTTGAENEIWVVTPQKGVVFDQKLERGESSAETLQEQQQAYSYGKKVATQLLTENVQQGNHEKQLPCEQFFTEEEKSLLRSSQNQRKTFLKGFLDNYTQPLTVDNFYTKINTRGNTKTQRLVAEIARSLGIVTVVNNGNNESGDELSVWLHHSPVALQVLPVHIQGIALKKTGEYLTSKPHKLPYFQGWVKIENVEPVKSEPGRCIQVDSVDSTYMTVGYLPTHNTTMLNALSAAIPKDDRIITIEDALELRLSEGSHVVPLEAQPADSNGQNAITPRRLVKGSLRMRPNRIIMGEVRDEAALEMLQACNTGHEGSMSTIHANGANQAISRLAVMIAQGGEFPAEDVNWLVGSAIDIIVSLRRDREGGRRIQGVYEVPEVERGEPLNVVPLWEWERTGTDPVTNDPIGKYVEVNPISQTLTKKLELEWNPVPSWDDVVTNFENM